jgi:hypothetical protein
MNEMKVFQSRFADEYQEAMCQHLTFESLEKTAITLQRGPREFKGREFDRCCRIDYMGFAATDLLDIGRCFNPSNAIAKQFEKVFKFAEDLNKKDIFVKMRFLFMYPYSTSFFSVIQAESSTYRAAIDEPNFLRDFLVVNEIDSEKFDSSASIRNLRNSLNRIQKIIKNHGWDDDNPNILRIRFTPINVNVSLTIINEILLTSPYLLAKDIPESDKLLLKAPVIKISKDADKNSFEQYEDHFRYLWDLDTTMFSGDSTKYDPEKPDTLSKFERPPQVSFDAKAEKIQYLRNQKTMNKEVLDWKFRMRQMLKKLSFDTMPSPEQETLFIACSWEPDRATLPNPNQYARQLELWLNEDFGSFHNAPILSVLLLVAAEGRSLSRQIYAKLREATLAIIVLTKDIKGDNGKHYSKSNVLHEMGYLMRQVETTQEESELIDSRRVLILEEKGVEVPSNVSDVVRCDFESEKLSFLYRQIIEWLGNASDLITPDALISALKTHKSRIDAYVIGGKLIPEQADGAKERIDADIKLYESRKNKPTTPIPASTRPPPPQVP